MSESEKPIELGLTPEANPPTPPQVEYIPSPEALQFRKAEHVSEVPSGPRCAICARPVGAAYYHANGQVVCPACAQAVQSGQNAPPAHTLLKSFFYGLGAAIAGTALFAIVWIVTDYQLSLISILIGYIVGKSIRYASKGLGGRPQQILAVFLTYLSITVSVIPVVIYHQRHKSTSAQTAPAAAGQASQPSQPDASNPKARPQAISLDEFGTALVALVGIALVSPFLSLSQGVGGILTLVIIFFGLQRAWRITGRSNVLVMGPYQQSA